MSDSKLIVIAGSGIPGDAAPLAGHPNPVEGVVVQDILAGEPTSEFNPDIVKRSVVVAGHKTSVSLEDAFWHALKDIARERSMSLRSIVAEIDASRRGGNLSSAVRLYVLDHYRRRCGAAGSVSAAL